MKIEIEVLRVADVISRIVCKSPLSYHHHLKRLSRHDRIYVDAVSRTMAELSDKHAILFNGLINKLEISDENFDAVYKSVALEMFADGVINWGRIITLYAFAATIAQHFNDNGMENVSDSMIHINNQFVEEHLADWIVNKGGWDDFLEKFPSKTSMEDSIRKGLTVLTVVGLGTLAAMVATR